jgi:hypothetical protein
MKHFFLKTFFSMVGLGLLSLSAAFAQSDEATASPLVLGDSVRCQSGTTVQASFGGLATSGSFSDGGAGGSFTDVQTVGNTVSAYYNPPADYDTLVVLTFTTNDPDGPAGPASSSARFWVVKRLSLGSFTIIPNPICAGDTTWVRLTAPMYRSKYPWQVVHAQAISPGYPYGVSHFTIGRPGSSSINGRFIALPALPPGEYALGVKIESKSLGGGCLNDRDSSTATLYVGNPVPTVITEVSSSVCAGQAITLTVEGCPGSLTAQLSNASGSFASPVPLGPATIGSNQLLIPAGTPSGTGYRVRLLKNNAVVATSAPFAVGIPPVIQSLTLSQGVCPGATFTLSVQASGSGLTYQWYRVVNASPQAIAGATSASLTLQPPTVPGSYLVVVGNSCGLSVTSQTITLSPRPPTILRVSSVVSSVCEGGTLTLSVAGTGPGTLSYAWTKDNQVVGTGSSLTLQNAQVPDAGSYVCTLTSECTSVQVSIPVTVRYLRITTQPQSVNLCSGQTTLSVGVQAVGVTPTYQWKRNGTNIAGATSASYVVAASRPGNYTVVVTTGCATLTSNAATVGCASSRLAAESVEEPGLEVAPNPVSGGVIRVRVRGMDTPEFSLTSSTGRSVGITSKGEGGGEWVLTPRQALVPGVYVVEARQGASRLTRRVLVME